MGNRVVSTKLSDEEHERLIEACGTAGKSPSAFIRELVKQVSLKRSQLQENGSGTTSSRVPSQIDPKESHTEDNQPEISDNTGNNLESLMERIGKLQRRRLSIKVRKLKEGDSLDGEIVTRCPGCNELH